MDERVQVLEIRTYRLVPGTRDRLHEIMRTGPVPALGHHGITVVDYGPPLVDEPGTEEYYLLRAFASLAERDRLEQAFYGSAEWRDNWREEVLACIESYHTIVVEAPPAVIAGLARRSHTP